MQLLTARQSYFLLNLLPKTRFPENGSPLLIGQFKERNAKLEWAAISGEDRCVTTLSRVITRDWRIQPASKIQERIPFVFLGVKNCLVFLTFPVTRTRRKKIVWFLLAATSNHMQVRLDCTIDIHSKY